MLVRITNTSIYRMARESAATACRRSSCLLCCWITTGAALQSVFVTTTLATESWSFRKLFMSCFLSLVCWPPTLIFFLRCTLRKLIILVFCTIRYIDFCLSVSQAHPVLLFGNLSQGLYSMVTVWLSALLSPISMNRRALSRSEECLYVWAKSAGLSFLYCDSSSGSTWRAFLVQRCTTIHSGSCCAPQLIITCNI